MSGHIDNMSTPGTSDQNVSEITASNMHNALNDTSVSKEINPNNKDTTTQPRRKGWILNDLRMRGLKRPVGLGPWGFAEDTSKASKPKQMSRKRSAEDAELPQSSSEPQAKKTAKKAAKTKFKNSMEREREYYNNLTAAKLLDHELDAGSHVSSAVAPEAMGARLSEYADKLAEADKAGVEKEMNPTPSTIVNKQRPRGRTSKQGPSVFIQKAVPKKVLADKTNTQRQPASQREQGSVKATAKQMPAATAKEQRAAPQKTSSSAHASSHKKRSRVEDEDEVVETTATVAKKQRVDPTPGPTVSEPKVSAAPGPATANMSKVATETLQAAAKDSSKEPKGKRARDATDDDVAGGMPVKKAKTVSTDNNEENASTQKPQKKSACDATEEEQEIEGLPDSISHIEEEASAKKSQEKRTRDAIEKETEVEALPKNKTKVDAVDLPEGEGSSNKLPTASEIRETGVEEADIKEAETKEAETKEAETKEAETKETEVEEAAVEHASADQANVEQPKIDAEDEENATDNSTKTTTSSNTGTQIAPKTDANAQPQRKKGVAHPTKPKPKAKKAPAASKENDARKNVRKYVKD